MEGNVLPAFMLTIMAGLASGIGSAIAIFVKDKSTKLLTFALGFAAGVMLYVSFVEILPHSIEELVVHHGGDQQLGTTYGVLAFFVGMLIVAIIDKIIPHAENPHEFSVQEQGQPAVAQPDKLMRIGLLTALALALHNFPEGMATFITALDDPQLGLTIAIAIAIHNIPEGIAVSMPIYFATGNRVQAFKYSFLSGVVEPVGAVVGYFLMGPYATPDVMGLLLAGVAGSMV